MSVTVCGSSGHYKTTVNRVDGEPRWCFKCRTKQEFRYIVKWPTHTEDMWYGPRVGIYCSTCHTNDGDCFPGIFREWDC